MNKGVELTSIPRVRRFCRCRPALKVTLQYGLGFLSEPSSWVSLFGNEHRLAAASLGYQKPLPPYRGGCQETNKHVRCHSLISMGGETLPGLTPIRPSWTMRRRLLALHRDKRHSPAFPDKLFGDGFALDGDGFKR